MRIRIAGTVRQSRGKGMQVVTTHTLSEQIRAEGGLAKLIVVIFAHTAKTTPVLKLCTCCMYGTLLTTLKLFANCVSLVLCVCHGNL